MPHLPMSLGEKISDELFDFIIVTGDAYVDHQSFGTAIIGRVLAADGFSVGIISQPNPKNEKDFLQLGLPKYAFLVNSGNIDSMVNHYTAAKRRRSSDAYTENGEPGKRPDRAVEVYCKMLRKCTKNIPIICGGIEASLRRFAHYDYWSDSVRESELVKSDADLLIYGMGETPILEIANLLRDGVCISEITDVRSTCIKTETADPHGTLIPDFKTISLNKKAYSGSAYTIYGQQDAVRGKAIFQQYCDENGADFFFVKQNPPAHPLSATELDRVYELPYMGTPHPRYKGKIPAVEEISFSIVHNRGCFGGCNFCALTLHQGRTITSRSKESLIREGEKIAARPDFKGYIHDVGGPTANFRAPSCQKQLTVGVCKNRDCLGTDPCKSIQADHSEYLDILRALREIKGVKKVFVRSGLRYDYMLLDNNTEFFRELVKHHISGQLKVAPEHISDNVLALMGKPPASVFDRFHELYKKYNKEYKKDQYLVPYLMSSHPGSGLKEAIQLAVYLKKNKLYPEQVQDFYPTPGTISTAMYFTGLNPIDGQRVYVAKNQDEKDMQRALLQFFRPQNEALVRKALLIAKREDLIGYGENCLIRPEKSKGGYSADTRDKGAVFIRDIGGFSADAKADSNASGTSNERTYKNVKSSQAEDGGRTQSSRDNKPHKSQGKFKGTKNVKFRTGAESKGGNPKKK